jgi:2-polyprenyl-6-methoxyphenol hydroxylase-like FAD-dependent oxidoreductase
VNGPQSTSCLISGGGPAGMMLGLLLARGGVDVTVMEKHADFLRDFRGDTVTRARCDCWTTSDWDASFSGSPTG